MAYVPIGHFLAAMGVIRKIKAFFARTGSAVGRFFRDLKSFMVRGFYGLKRLIAVSANLLAAYWKSLHEKPQTRFLTMAWAFVIVFLGMMILSGSNPFRLLIPGLTFRWPVRDARSAVRLYQVPRGSDKPAPVERRILIDQSVERNAERIAVAITSLTETEDELSTAIMEPIPELGFALRKAWYRSDKGELILDFRGQTIQEEMDRFFRGRGDAGKKERSRILDMYFNALTQSIFSALAEPKTIVFLLDGRSTGLEDMTFKLNEKKNR